MRRDNGDGHWDVEIGSKGPIDKSFVRDIVRSKDLVLILAHRDLVSVYKQTLLGPLWIVIQPILATLMYFFIFGEIAAISTDGIPSLLFYLTGITFWVYFSSNLLSASDALIQNEHLFSKVYFPRLVVVISGVLSNTVKFSVQLMILVSVITYYKVRYDTEIQLETLFLLPVVMLVILMLSVGLGLLFSSINIKYKDLRHLQSFIMQILMYTSCVVFPYSAIPDNMKNALWWNPLVHLFECIRYAIYGVGDFDMFGIVYSISLSVFLLISVLFIFSKVVHSFIDAI